jgi:hypothetical protein
MGNDPAEEEEGEVCHRYHDDRIDDDRVIHLGKAQRDDDENDGDRARHSSPISPANVGEGDGDDEMSRFAELLRASHRPPLDVVRVEGDGNCLFRAVSLQVYGDVAMHAEVRTCCLDFMERESDHYHHFVVGGMDSEEEGCKDEYDYDDGGSGSRDGCARNHRGDDAGVPRGGGGVRGGGGGGGFREYVARKRQLGVHGNHAEIQAMSELYNRSIEVYVPSNGIVPINIFQSGYARGGGREGGGGASGEEDTGKKDDAVVGGGGGEGGDVPIRLCYTNGEHYDALVDPMLPTAGLGLGLPGLHVGLADRMQLEEAKEASIEGALKEKMMVALEESRRAIKEREEMEIGEALRMSVVVGVDRGMGKSSMTPDEDDMFEKKAMYLSEMESADFDLEQAVECA